MQFKRSLTLLLPDYIGIDLINLINQNSPNNRKSIKNLLYSNHTNLTDHHVRPRRGVGNEVALRAGWVVATGQSGGPWGSGLEH